jgi:type I restriction-modification system DNA methylase subunit
MGLFQTSVINKYLKTLDNQNLKAAFESFKLYFHNSTVQENIRNSKEEQFQEGFLRELFVKILGYTLNPSSNFNLTTEFKNVKDSKKADGAIIINEVVKAVIELKGCNTTDLGKIESQAFGYKNNQPECVYVITSNFEKLRFYIDNAIEHIEFNLFAITQKEFDLLYLCLSFESIEKGIPKKLKNESLSQEDIITKKLYQDYSLFKRELHKNLVELNPQFDKLTLFKKSQKLLDRFLFLLFAEDRQLLPPNSVRMVLDYWNQLKDMDEYKTLYYRFQKYFGYLNDGYKGKKYNVFAYNGGLFKADEVLDNVLINDELLYKHTLKLSEYDFASEVDVNILGHIFENSLNELDEIKAQLEGTEIDKTKTKRKKEGVFYTPNYITKYIVDNTVGKLCTEKKAELLINEEDYITDKRRQKKTTQVLAEKLTTYRNWLLQLKICDPACGSGAFLNQALDFLITEHQYVDELQAKLFGDALILSDIENSILENNLFGVDLNEESVEIARLSLWLRTAKPNRKLNDLSNNIKCGNSLIDDPEVAGEKAFNWFLEFPKVFPHYRKPKTAIPYEPEPGDRDYLDEVQEPLYSYKPDSKGFEKYGFDVIIGNPPYVRAELISQYTEYFQKNYKTFQPAADLFTFFYEKGYSILNHKGICGFISNTFDKTKAAIELRNWLKENITITEYIDFTEVQIFEGATTYPVILIAKNQNPINNFFKYVKITKGNESEIDLYNPIILEQNSLEKENWSFNNNQSSDILKKLQLHPVITEKYGKTYYGIKTALNEAFLIPKGLLKDDAIIKPIFEGRELNKWTNFEPQQSLILFKSKSTKLLFGNLEEANALEKIKHQKPELINHLLAFEQKAKTRYDKGDYWWELRNCAYYHLFEHAKIVFPNLQNKNKFSFDEKGIFINAPAVMLSLAKLSNPLQEGKFLLAILNSKLIWFFLKSICVVRSGGYIEVKPQYFEQIPIPNIDSSAQLPFIEKAEQMLTLNKALQELTTKFQRSIQREFNIADLPNKLQNWHLLTYPEFVKELEKKKIKPSLSQKAEWEDYFKQESKKALELKTQIETTDAAIDAMVYQLYELTEEEIAIVEDKTK